MDKRGRKPSVNQELRREWLRRFDVEGESAARIAKHDGYDRRTVRKYIALARQEMEQREARAMVLRQALERHYADLCAFAQELNSDLTWPPSPILPMLRQDPMWKALREHLPRSPIWKAIRRWEQLADQYDFCVKQIRDQTRAAAQERGLKFAQVAGEPGLTEGLADSVVFNVASVARTGKGLKDVAAFSHTEVTGTSLREARMGAFGLGWVLSDETDKLQRAYLELLDEALSWPSAGELRQVISESNRRSAVLHEELTTITLRRVVQGRCRYCPV